METTDRTCRSWPCSCRGKQHSFFLLPPTCAHFAESERYLSVKKIFSEWSWRPVCVCVCVCVRVGWFPPPQDCATLIDRGMCSSHPDSMTNDTRQADCTPTTTARPKENHGGRENANSYLTLSISYIQTDTNFLALYRGKVFPAFNYARNMKWGEESETDASQKPYVPNGRKG